MHMAPAATLVFDVPSPSLRFPRAEVEADGQFQRFRPSSLPARRADVVLMGGRPLERDGRWAGRVSLVAAGGDGPGPQRPRPGRAIATE